MKNVSASHRTALVWLLLMSATVLSYNMGHALGIDNTRVVSVVVLIIAFVKVWLVAFEFMELRNAPRLMLWVVNLWLVVIGAALIGLYWLG